MTFPLVIANPVFDGTVSRKRLLDLTEARIPIETTTTALASTNATGEHFAEMDRLLQRAGEHLHDDTISNEMNLAFHQQIAIASGNSVLQQLLDVWTKLFSREQRIILNIQNTRAGDHAEHLAIVAALKPHQTKLAVARMRGHLQNVPQVLQQVLPLWDPTETPLN